MNKENQSQIHMDSCVDSVLSKIEAQNLTPRSKWYFILKDELFWGIGAISVAIGSCSVAAALFALTHSDFGLREVTHDSFFEFAYDALPFMWILSLIIFMFVGYVQVKHTKRGYKYPIYIIIGGSLVLSIAGGIVLHQFGFGERFEREFGPYIPFHVQQDALRERMWLNSGRGVISGELVSVDLANQSFVIKDFSGRPWVIEAIDLNADDVQVLELADKVRVIGLPTIIATGTMGVPVGSFNQNNRLVADILATSTMHACIVMPWDTDTVPPIPVGIDHPVDLSRGPVLPGDLPTIDPRLENHPMDTIDSNAPAKTKFVSPKSERKIPVDRSTKCKDIRPYQLIIKMRAEAQN